MSRAGHQWRNTLDVSRFVWAQKCVDLGIDQGSSENALHESAVDAFDQRRDLRKVGYYNPQGLWLERSSEIQQLKAGFTLGCRLDEDGKHGGLL